MNGLDEVQGNILTGYSHGHCARMFLCEITRRDEAKQWLSELLPRITTHGSAPHADGLRINVGFTYAGLVELGLDGSELSDFDAPFREGMQRRKQRLGDSGTVVDRDASWGGKPLHLVVLLYLDEARIAKLRPALREEGALARDPHTRWHERDGRELRDQLTMAFETAESSLLGLRGLEARRIDLHHPLVSDYGVEYFGFRDGVSNPEPLKEGELDQFVLNRPGDLLLHGGSFMVLRQLEQDIETFWSELCERAYGLELSPCELAESLMGRRRDGAPLDGIPGEEAHVPAFTPGSGPSRCPFASHVRRMNPKIEGDSGSNPRIIRRALSYLDEHDKRGLMFIAFNADIAGQFEFIQKNWVQRGNNSAGSRSCDFDVIAGTPHAQDGKTCFSFAPDAARTRTLDLPSFVSLVEGEYLFVPSRSALALIAAEPLANGIRPLPAADFADPIGLMLGRSRRALRAEEQKLLQKWLDHPSWSRRFWEAVLAKSQSQSSGSGTVEIGEYVFVAEPTKVVEILENERDEYTMSEYARRMAPATGDFFLGMDEHEARYQRERKTADFLAGVELDEVTRNAERAVLELFAKAVARQRLADDQEAPARATVREMLAFMLDGVVGESFGLHGVSRGSLASWGRDLALYFFRLFPSESDEQKAVLAAQQYRGHALQRFTEAERSDPAAPRLLEHCAHIRAQLASADPGLEVSSDDVVRNFVGVVTGSLGATMKLFLEGLTLHLSAQRTSKIAWPDESSAGSLYAAIIQTSLARHKRGGPDSLYRKRRSDGKVVVLWLGGAQQLDPEILFGRGAHKCPGMAIGQAMIEGMLRALRQRDGVFRGAEESLAFEFATSQPASADPSPRTSASPA